MSKYYLKKYSYSYPFCENDGTLMEMCTIPLNAQVKMYKARLGAMPRSYFDCGAATGALVFWAENIGLRARGIDVRRYNPIQPFGDVTEPYFASGKIKIASILDVAPIHADLAYCNGTLTYMDEVTLPLALSKFRNVGLLIAIHNTTEDLRAAAAMGDPIVHTEPRLIRGKNWWMQAFRDNGFSVDYDAAHNCFCARPNAMTKDRLRDMERAKRVQVDSCAIPNVR